jgi:hypothetical protein
MMRSARIASAVAVAAALSVTHAAQAQDACIAASESATTARTAGKLLDAREALSTCAASSCSDAVKSSCQRRLAEIAQAIPSIVFLVRDEAGNDVPNVKVTMDGKRLGGGTTTAIELDPGQHSFTFEAEGQSATQKTYTVVEGARERGEVVTMVPAPLQGAVPSATPTASPAPPPGGGWTTTRTLGVVAGGVGIAGLGVGLVFGVLAASAWNSAQSECDGSTPATCPNRAGAVSDHNTTLTDAKISTVGFIAGGALVASGVTLFILGASRPDPSQPATSLVVNPVISPSFAGLSFGGAF